MTAISATVASAPGRICLAGESLDWMVNGPSVVASIGLRTRVSAHLVDTCADLRVHAGSPVNITRHITARRLDQLTGDPLDYVHAVAYLVSQLTPEPFTGTLVIDSELPVGAGVSSSASVTAATAAALLAASGIPPTPQTIAEVAHAGERHAGSGAGWMDFLAVVHGGINLVQATDPPRTTRLSQQLGAQIILVDSLTRRSTRSLLVSKRTRWANRDPDLLAYVDATEELVDAIAAALDAPAVDHASVGKLLTEAHWLLADRMRCSTPLLDACVRTCIDAGAYGAKLTGSGHGGCLFTLAPPDRTASVLDALVPLPVRTVVLDDVDPHGVDVTEIT